MSNSKSKYNIHQVDLFIIKRVEEHKILYDAESYIWMKDTNMQQ